MKTSFYIRFGNLPYDGKSYKFDEKGLICGKREGVSVFKAQEMPDGTYVPESPSSIAGTEVFLKYTEFNKDQQMRDQMFLVIGDFIDYDETGCPVITNVKIVEKLDFDRIYPGYSMCSQF